MGNQRDIQLRSTDATLQRDGLPSFRLAFDLPFHELRAETAIEYLPRRGDGGVLRFSEDVSFLAVRSPKSSNAATGTSKYHLCEAHVSCVVWGTNNSRWEAVMFLDIFSGSRESIVEYEYDPDNPGQMEQDPLRAGKAADRLILDPRLYFLDTFAVRIKRVKGKWRDLFDTLNLEIKASVGPWVVKFLDSVRALRPIHSISARGKSEINPDRVELQHPAAACSSIEN